MFPSELLNPARLQWFPVKLVTEDFSFSLVTFTLILIFFLPLDNCFEVCDLLLGSGPNRQCLKRICRSLIIRPP